jgi:signal transduction histidine kinase
VGLAGIRSRVAAIPAWAVDGALAVLVCAGVLGRGLGEGQLDRWLVVAAAVLSGGGLLLRRARPLPALALACAGGLPLAAGGMTELSVVAVGLTGYMVGAVSERGRAIVAALVAAAGLSAGVPLAEAALDLDTQAGPVPLVATVAGAIAVGYAVRSRRELAVALQERARRRAIEERLHIARELHDTVGHQIAVINVQAGVAAHHLRDRPEAAEQALGHVRTAARGVLDELATVLSVLREPGSASGTGGEDAPTEPAPRLSELDQLVAFHARAGTRVEWTVSGGPRKLPPPVELSAYRTIQESLTNAGRHGRGVVRLRLTYTADELRIEVRNAVGQPGAGGRNGATPGYGLIGMTERVAAVGGALSAGTRPGGGEFVVSARLPAPLDGGGS